MVIGPVEEGSFKLSSLVISNLSVPQSRRLLGGISVTWRIPAESNSEGRHMPSIRGTTVCGHGN